MYWTSLYLVPSPSWWCLSGYGARVPTIPKVLAAPKRKLGTQASGAFLEESTSLPSLLPYKVLWYPLCWMSSRDKTHLTPDSCRQNHHCHCLCSKIEQSANKWLLLVSKGLQKTVLVSSAKPLCFLDQKWDKFISYQGMLMVRSKGSGTYVLNKAERSLSQKPNDNRHSHTELC